MRATTEYWLGVRHVGAREVPDDVELLSARDIVKRFAEVIASSSLATRIDVCIARTEDEVRERLNGRVSGTGSRSTPLATDDDYLDSLFAGIGED